MFYSYKDVEKKFIKEEYDQRKQTGFNVEYFDESSSKGKFSFDVSAGIYSKKLAGEIDPYRFIHSLIRESINNGLRLFENTEAVLIENNNGIKITKQNGFIINAKKVVIATGYKARKYFKNVAIMTRTFDIVTKPIKDNYGWYNKCLVRDSDNPYFYIRSTADNRIIGGGLDEDLGGDRSKMFNLCQEDEVSQDKYTAIFNKLKGMFTEIKDLEYEYGFSGFFGETKDGLPYIGEHSDYQNHYFCMAYGSNGVINAVIGSRLLKDLYIGNRSQLLELFRLDR